MKWLLRGVVALVAVYVIFFGAVLLAMLQPPERFGQVMKHLPAPLVWGALPAPRMWLWARKGDLKRAARRRISRCRRHDHASRVTLSSHRGQRPVVLVFGSYT